MDIGALYLVSHAIAPQIVPEVLTFTTQHTHFIFLFAFKCCKHCFSLREWRKHTHTTHHNTHTRHFPFRFRVLQALLFFKRVAQTHYFFAPLIDRHLNTNLTFINLMCLIISLIVLAQ
jgi:hypothetical protein